MRFVCTSDTHTLHERVPIPDGDVFIHAGDFTSCGELPDIARFNAFLGKLPHKHKIVIAGNHDFAFERQPALARSLLTNCLYLQDSETVIDGVRIYGSPWQPWFNDWAFNLQRGPEIKARWDRIPDDVQILVTHGPAFGHGDEVLRPSGGGERVGCEDLLAAIQRIKPVYHVCGHVHEGYGITKEGPTICINACMCDDMYNSINPPIVFDLCGKR